MAVYADQIDLRHAVASHCGDFTLTDAFKTDLLQAEARLNQRLRLRQMITDDTLTFTSGEAALPADFIEMINVYDSYRCPMRATSIANVQRSGSQYSRYAIDGSNILIYGFSGDRDITYFAKPPTLSTSDTTTNWLLTQYPDIYLYAVAWQALVRAKNVELAGATKELLEDAIRSARVDDERSRWGNSSVNLASMVTP